MVKRFDWLLVCLLFSIGVMAQSGGKQYNSYKGLVMLRRKTFYFMKGL